MMETHRNSPIHLIVLNVGVILVLMPSGIEGATRKVAGCYSTVSACIGRGHIIIQENSITVTNGCYAR